MSMGLDDPGYRRDVRRRTEAAQMRSPFPWSSSVRSVLAVTIVGTYCGLALTGKIDAASIKEIVMLSLTFYFLKDRKKGGEP
jgi:hypothetical protein